MNPIIELEKSEREVQDLEARCVNVRDGLNSIEREISLLTLKEIALSENIKNLKQHAITIMASEFRRSKEDLKRTETRLEMIRKDKSNLENALKVTLDFLDKARLKLDELRKMEVTNVIYGKFGDQSDQ